MNTNKMLKVSKATVVLVFSVVWILLKAIFTFLTLAQATPVRIVGEDSSKSHSQWATFDDDDPRHYPGGK